MSSVSVSVLPTDCIVTRHPGAAEWVQRRLGRAVRVIDHLLPQEIEPGIRYHGVFPLNLAADICRAGAQCWAISVQLPSELRGHELSAEQLETLGARLVRYQVSEISTADLETGPSSFFPPSHDSQFEQCCPE